jgi:hypothetical protein
MDKIDKKDLIARSNSPSSDLVIANKINEIVDWINELDKRFETAKKQLEKIKI